MRIVYLRSQRVDRPAAHRAGARRRSWRCRGDQAAGGFPGQARTTQRRGGRRARRAGGRPGSRGSRCGAVHAWRALARVTIAKTVYSDMRRMEALLRDSDLRWTIMRPSKLFDAAVCPATSSTRIRRRPRASRLPRPRRSHCSRGPAGRLTGPPVRGRDSSKSGWRRRRWNLASQVRPVLGSRLS